MWYNTFLLGNIHGDYPDGLLSAIACEAVKLGELNLSHCSLPTTALPFLAKIVKASADSLQRLDLQGNSWEMNTNAALRDWEEFLDSSSDCVKLRKVNFSDNRLGDKGIEALVRVYTRSLQHFLFESDDDPDFADEILSRSISGVLLPHSDDEDDISSPMASPSELSSTSTSALAASLPIKSSRRKSEDLRNIPTCGLPSVAYIHLQNVGMTDLSALHLTFLLQYHHLPHVLLRRLDAHVADNTMGRDDELYDRDTLCRGVTYDFEDSDFSPLAKKLLESVEKVRRAGGPPPEAYLRKSSLTVLSSSVPPSPDSFRSRRNSDSSRGYFPETPSPLRKDSVSSIRTMASTHIRMSIGQSPKSDVTTYWTDVVKIRPKIQGEILKDATTVHISQLWSAAVKLLSLARVFTLPQPRKKVAPYVLHSLDYTPRTAVPPTLPLSPVSPGTPKIPKLRSHCVGALDINLWMRILIPIADPEGILSETQAMNVVSWASDRNSLAKEGELAGKLTHVQMWRLLDVCTPKIIILKTIGLGVSCL